MLQQPGRLRGQEPARHLEPQLVADDGPEVVEGPAGRVEQDGRAVRLLPEAAHARGFGVGRRGRPVEPRRAGGAGGGRRVRADRLRRARGSEVGDGFEAGGVDEVVQDRAPRELGRLRDERVDGGEGRPGRVEGRDEGPEADAARVARDLGAQCSVERVDGERRLDRVADGSAVEADRRLQVGGEEAPVDERAGPEAAKQQLVGAPRRVGDRERDAHLARDVVEAYPRTELARARGRRDAAEARRVGRECLEHAVEGLSREVLA
ncbi:MAG: hypothetical protein F4Z60_13265, partial [Chloroflexi bacterium]|nr:hypothetical protein [Chloroflexota bacterium]